MITTYLVVPAWSDLGGQCRIVARVTATRVSKALDDYRACPDDWREVGTMNSAGRIVCLDAQRSHATEMRASEPLMGGTVFDFVDPPAAVVCPRTFALHQPGTPRAGVYCSPAWSGAMPRIGQYRCYRCGHNLQAP